MIEIPDVPTRTDCASCALDGCEKPRRRQSRLCYMHASRVQRHGSTDLPVRVVDRAALMWAKLDVADCWLFTGFVSKDGYGNFWNGSRAVKAHRWVWEYLVGPITDGLELDHLCRQRACCNPDHLEPVTPRENTLRSSAPTANHARKTHCPQGHPYAGDNLIVAVRPTGQARICRTCDRQMKRDYDARNPGRRR